MALTSVLVLSARYVLMQSECHASAGVPLSREKPRFFISCEPAKTVPRA
jgi:hypothetical protein